LITDPATFGELNMSAYLMSDYDTKTLGALAHHLGLAKSPTTAARVLRKANNDALACRYGDKPAPLRGTVDPVEFHLSTASSFHFAELCARFEYQCAEGDYENRPGVVLLGKIRKELDL